MQYIVNNRFLNLILYCILSYATLHAKKGLCNYFRIKDKSKRDNDQQLKDYRVH